MRTVKTACTLLALCLLFLSSTTVQAKTSSLSPVDEALKKEIKALIKKPELRDYGTIKETVRIQFMINDQHEIVVLTTNASDPIFDTYLKHKLNYRKIKSVTKKPGPYIINISFKAN
jgi:hypothetical protein